MSRLTVDEVAREVVVGLVATEGRRLWSGIVNDNCRVKAEGLVGVRWGRREKASLAMRLGVRRTELGCRVSGEAATG